MVIQAQMTPVLIIKQERIQCTMIFMSKSSQEPVYQSVIKNTKCIYPTPLLLLLWHICCISLLSIVSIIFDTGGGVEG